MAGWKASRGMTSADLHKLQSVGGVQLSPDGNKVAYSITHNERPGRPYSDTWIRDLTTGKVAKLNSGAGPRWSRDGRWVAYQGRLDDTAGLIVADQNGEGERLVTPIERTNHPLPSSGESIAWSPDGRSIAFVSAAPGPETENANGDPMVITRYLYKPTATEGLTRFNDNRRLHLYRRRRSARARCGSSRPARSTNTRSTGRRTATRCCSSRTAKPTPTRPSTTTCSWSRVNDGAVRRLTNTKSAEYHPVWSPDGTRIAFLGTKRDLTSSETTMEDTHVWVMNADGSNRLELGAGIDNRQGEPQWSPDGKQRLLHGAGARLHEVDAAGGAGHAPGAAGAPAPARRSRSWRSPGRSGRGRCAARRSPMRSPHAGGPSELFLKVAGDAPAAQLTTLNQRLSRQQVDRAGRSVHVQELRRHRDRSVPHQARRR